MIVEQIRFATELVYCPKCSAYVCEWTIENIRTDNLPKETFTCREPGCKHKFVAKFAIKEAATDA